MRDPSTWNRNSKALEILWLGSTDLVKQNCTNKENLTQFLLSRITKTNLYI